MHGGMQYDPIQDQGCESYKVGNPSIFKSYLLRHLQWELATYHWFLNWGTISKFDRVGFLIFILFLVSCKFELGRNVSCKESTVPHEANLFMFVFFMKLMNKTLWAGMQTLLSMWQAMQQMSTSNMQSWQNSDGP